MLAFPHDRFLSTDTALRILVLAPESGATSVSSTRALDLHLAFVLRDRTSGRAVNLQGTRSLKEDEVAYFRVPWSYGEFPLKNVPPGSYTLQAMQGADVVAQASIVVLDPAVLTAAMDELAIEKPAVRTLMESAAMLLPTWEAAWTDLYSYLSVPLPAHISVAVAQPLRTSPATAGRLSQESFRWVLFHVHRLLFGTLLLGGNAAFSQSSDNLLQFRYAVQARATTEPVVIEAQLEQLRRLIRADDYSVTFDWKPEAPTAVFRLRATFEMTWAGPRVG
jgi:hypothetical protein